eukprot:410095_1
MTSKTLLCVGVLIAYMLAVYLKTDHSFIQTDNDRIVLTQTQIDTYNREGLLIFDKPLFNEKELSIITKQIEKQIDERPDGIGPEYILGYHFNNSFLLQLASNPKVLDIVEQLLNVSDVGIRIFTTRILSKPANNKSIVVPWHQDSNYWTHLNPLKVVSLWLAIDDVDADNGAMQIYNFSSCKCKDKNLPIIEVHEENGLDFFRYIDDKALPDTNLITHLYLKKGYASFHDAYVPHFSPTNSSPNKRRCAWIVRYCRGDTVIVPGQRKLFPVGYNLMKVR